MYFSVSRAARRLTRDQLRRYNDTYIDVMLKVARSKNRAPPSSLHPDTRTRPTRSPRPQARPVCVCKCVCALLLAHHVLYECTNVCFRCMRQPVRRSPLPRCAVVEIERLNPPDVAIQSTHMAIGPSCSNCPSESSWNPASSRIAAHHRSKNVATSSDFQADGKSTAGAHLL